MGWILFVLALFVIATQCTVIKNEELAHKRVARSPCVDCDDWPPPPPPPPGPPRPRYHGYPRYLDYPPPSPPPPPPFYYPHGPPPPPPPPFYRHHWHKVINDSDENDDNDGDYDDSASAVSGVTGQTSGQAFSTASAGIKGGDNSKYNRYGAHYSSGSQSANNGGQSSESFEKQSSGSKSGAQLNSNAQTGSNIQSPNIGALSTAGSSAKSSSQISTGSNTLSRQGGAQSTVSANTQSIQTGSKSSAASNVHSYLNNNIQTTRRSQVQVSGQSSLNTHAAPEFGSAAGGTSSLDVQSSGLNQQSSNNFGGSFSEGSNIQSSVFGDHSSVGANRQPINDGSSAVSQSSSNTASIDSNNNYGQFDGSNTKTTSFRESSSADSNTQSSTGQGSKASASSNAQSSGLGDQSSVGLNIQSSRDIGGGSSAVSQSNNAGKQFSSASTPASSNNGDFVGQFPTGYQSSVNSKAQSSVSHHTSGDKQSSNTNSDFSYGSVNTQSSDNGFANQSPVDFKPLYSDNFNDSPTVSSSSESGVSSRPSVDVDNQSSINFGGTSFEGSNSQITGQKPIGHLNSQSPDSFGALPSGGSNIQSSRSKSSTSFSKHSSNNLATSSFKGGQSNDFNLNSFENGGSSEVSKPQPIGSGPEQPININDKPSTGPTQSVTFGQTPSSNLGSSNTQSQFSGVLSPDNFAPQPSGPSDTSKLKPGGFQPHPLSGFNNQHFKSSSEFSTKGSNSQFSSSSHKFSTVSNKQSSSNGGSSFTQFGLGDQSGGVNSRPTENFRGSSSETANAQFSDLNHHHQGGFLDQSSDNMGDWAPKGFGQFPTESVTQSTKSLDDFHSSSSKIDSNDHSDETSASLDSQSAKNVDNAPGQRGDIPPLDDHMHIPLSGLTSIGNGGNSAQGDNSGSIENAQQSFSSETFSPGVDNSGPATDLSGLTASGLRKSFKLKGFESADSGSSFLSIPKADSTDDDGGQSSTNYNSQFSDLKKQSPHNFGTISSSESQTSYNNGPSYASNSQSGKVDSGSSTNDQFSFSTQSSTGNKKSSGFDVNSSNTNTQSLNSFGSWSSQNSNIHSFSMGDEMCVCGPRKSALFTAISKSGALNGFDSQSVGSTGESSGGIDTQTSGGSLGNKAGAQPDNDQSIYKETHYSLLNGNGNVAGYGVQFETPNLGYDNRQDQIDASKITVSSDVSNNNGLKLASKQGPPLQPNQSTPPSRLLLPPLGPSPAPPSNSPASTPGASPSVPKDIGNNDQRKEVFESQQYEYNGDNPALYTDQQQTSDFGSFGSEFGSGSSRRASGSTSSDSKGGNGFGISGSIDGGRSFGTGSSSSGYISSDSRGFGDHGSINKQGHPSSYGSVHFDTQRTQGTQTPSESGGSSYALSNAQSKNRDAFAVSVGL